MVHPSKDQGQSLSSAHRNQLAIDCCEQSYIQAVICVESVSLCIHELKGLGTQTPLSSWTTVKPTTLDSDQTVSGCRLWKQGCSSPAHKPTETTSTRLCKHTDMPWGYSTMWAHMCLHHCKHNTVPLMKVNFISQKMILGYPLRCQMVILRWVSKQVCLHIKHTPTYFACLHVFGNDLILVS